jgi:YidC/Oxa1 family membrane protein insertase
MNQTRSFLLIAWLFAAGWLFLKWNEWNTLQNAPPAATAVAATVSSNPSSTAPAPLPEAPGATNAPTTLPGTAPAASTSATPASRMITLSNDELRLDIDLSGGRVARAQLLQYTVEKKAGSPNVVLLDDESRAYYSANAGLITLGKAGARNEPLMQFTAKGADFQLGKGAVAISVPLQWTDPATGITVLRTLTLKRGSYVLEVEDRISNAGDGQVYPFLSLARVAPPTPPKHSFVTNPDSFSFVGSAWYSQDEKFEKTPFNKYDKEKPPGDSVADSWIGMLQHHFITAWVPQPTDKQLIQTATSVHDGLPLYEVRSIASPIAAGTTQVRKAKLWVGPKLQTPMSKLAPSLTRGVDYGMLYPISQPIFLLLQMLHKLFGNWGWSIIAVVLILKAALYWPAKKQYQSMAKMRAVQPRIEALKERYGDDKQALNVAMFELYKKEKVNPAAGCWPVLIQMPIFLGLYWVLVETVELRHAPWMGWIQNLTAPDPYFVLPALNLLVMFLTQRMTPTPGMDPMQRKMMQFMPLVFGVMMAFFPSGLVLYWVTNGSLGLLQQWHMMRRYGTKPVATAVAR